MREVMFALTATAFAVVFLVSIIIFGGHQARTVAIATSFLATVSQFTAQDPVSYRISIYSAYAAFVAGLIAFILFASGV